MKRVRVFAMLLMTSLLLFGCGKEKETVADNSAVMEKEGTTDKEGTGDQADGTVKKERGQKDGMVESYLTGEYVSEKIANRRPIAIMVNNIQAACPQSGISRYGVMYEAPVEGALTRLMPIIEDYDGLERIGSVRSCRDYFIYYMLEFNAIYCHYGQAVYAEELLAEDFVKNLNGLEGVGATVYYRSVEKAKPHNVFASTDGILKGIEQKGYSLEYDNDYNGHYNFIEDGKEVKLEKGYNAKVVKPGYLINKPWFEYNENDGLYYRYQYGEKHIDDLNNEQLTAKNIILQYTAWCNYDDHGYLSLNAVGGGQGVYITNGKAIDITWGKPSEYAAARYFDTDGNEIEFNRGKTWVCVIQDTYAKNVVISAK